MILRSSSRLPLRLKKDVSTPQQFSPVLNSIRQASTAQVSASEAAAQEVRPSKRALLRDTRIATPQEISYNARKRAGAKKLRPPQVDMYTKRLLDTRTAAIKARQSKSQPSADETPDNPVHGRSQTTPFLQSLDLGMPVDKVFIPNEDGVPVRKPAAVDIKLKDQTEILSSENTGVARTDHIAHFFSTQDLDRFGQISAALSRPVVSTKRAAIDPQAELQKKSQHEEDHATRMSAVARIMAVENMGSKQRYRVNSQRIIDEFGRHRTDLTIDPRQNIRQPYHAEDWTPKQRIGPDTGSSEVQIGLLTAKIKLLAAAYEGKQRNDKMNKRNLRLLLHRRQKLLSYFYRRDRGGERWQHMVEKLGITPAMWKGEIELR